MKINYKIFLIYIAFLSSCAYPDVDSVPEYNSLNISQEEKIDTCKLNNLYNKEPAFEKESCFDEIIPLIQRL